MNNALIPGFETAERGVPREGVAIRGEHFKLLDNLIKLMEREGAYEDGIRLREVYRAMDGAFPTR